MAITSKMFQAVMLILLAVVATSRGELEGSGVACEAGDDFEVCVSGGLIKVELGPQDEGFLHVRVTRPNFHGSGYVALGLNDQLQMVGSSIAVCSVRDTGEVSVTGRSAQTRSLPSLVAGETLGGMVDGELLGGSLVCHFRWPVKSTEKFRGAEVADNKERLCLVGAVGPVANDMTATPEYHTPAGREGLTCLSKDQLTLGYGSPEPGSAAGSGSGRSPLDTFQQEKGDAEFGEGSSGAAPRPSRLTLATLLLISFVRRLSQ